MGDNYRNLFLSHSSKNKDFVRKLAGDIEADEKLLVWVDEAEIEPGQSIPGKIEEGLKNSEFFGLVLTPEYFNSTTGWTYAEWHAILHSDPDNRQGRIIPILAETYDDIPLLLNHLNMIDFRGDEYNIGLRKLLRKLRREPHPRFNLYKGQKIKEDGRISGETLVAERAAPAAYPDRVEEVLYSNILPVSKIPEFLYSAPLRRTNRYWVYLDKVDSVYREYRGNILTFTNLSNPENPYAKYIYEDSVKKLRLEEFVKNEDRQRIITSLLNKAISRHAKKVSLAQDSDPKKQSRFYFTSLSGQENVKKWVRERKVAYPLSVDEWINFGAFLSFIFIGNEYFLKIKPTWLLTYDGKVPKKGSKVGSRIIHWTGKERNPQVLNHVLFLGHILSDGKPKISIKVGDAEFTIEKQPASVKLNRGLEFDQKEIQAIKLIHYEPSEEDLVETDRECDPLVSEGYDDA